MSKIQKLPTGPFHSGYGCAVMMIMFLTFSGIITWCGYTLLKQNKEISTFTVDNAPPLAPLTPSEDDKANLVAKMEDFRVALQGTTAADLHLSIAELNTLLVLAADGGIGGQDDSTPYRDLIHFAAFEPDAQLVRVDMRLPMNKLPWEGGGKRFLVGTAELQPSIDVGKNSTSFDVRLKNITVPGKTVNEGFIKTLQQMPWLSVAKTKPEIADAMSRIDSFQFTADGKALVLHAAATPAKPAPAK